MFYINRKDWEEAEKEILDEETGLTRADWLEYQHGNSLKIID